MARPLCKLEIYLTRATLVCVLHRRHL
eukprot:SAG11_NODE_22041_length_413_cov_0.990446_1_plen_26_part_10